MVTKSKSTKPLTAPSEPSPKPWHPHDYQKRAVKWMLERNHAGLFLEPGLGKTAITYAAFKVLKQKGFVKSMLVIAPKRVMFSVWPGERDEWEDFKGLSVGVLHGKDREHVLNTFHDVYVTNYDSIEWLSASGAMKVLIKDRHVNMLVFDELSKMKHTRTKRFKAMRPWLAHFSRRYGLTGSPASNGLIDLFGQIYTLDRGQRLGEYITHYRNNYFTPSGYMGYDWKPMPGADKRIQSRIKDLAMHMAADDYLELPPQVDNIVNVDLPPEARKLYDDMEDDLFSMIESGESLTAPTAAAAMNKCKQIANGAVYLNAVDPITGEPRAQRVWNHVHDAKIDALTDLVDEHQGQQILIAYEYVHDLDRLVKALPKGTAYIGSGSSGKEATRIEADWNAGKIPILLGHPQSIGHGLNLQKGNAKTIIWFSATWDYELYDQFNRRLRRQGNKADRIMVHHLVARDTVDKAVIYTLKSKQRTQSTLLDALKYGRRR